MAFWKRKEETKKESQGKNAALKPSRTNNHRPQSVLFWIDASWPDLSTRVIRGLAIAEAFQNAKVPTVTLACLENSLLPKETERRGVQWLNTRPNGNPITLTEIIKTTQADLVIADSLNPPKLQPGVPVVQFALLADHFSEKMLESSDIHTALFPGLIPDPDFSETQLLPSRCTACVHGPEYVALPADYFQSSEMISDKSVLIALAGNLQPDVVTPLFEAARSAWEGNITLLADVAPTCIQPLRNAAASRGELMTDLPLPDRLNAIRKARVILALPSPAIYEFFALGKPVILLPRTETEIQLSKTAAEKGIAQTILLSEPPEFLQASLKELIQNEKKIAEQTEKSRAYVQPQGAQKVTEVLLKRFQRQREIQAL